MLNRDTVARETRVGSAMFDGAHRAGGEDGVRKVHAELRREFSASNGHVKELLAVRVESFEKYMEVLEIVQS